MCLLTAAGPIFEVASGDATDFPLLCGPGGNFQSFRDWIPFTDKTYIEKVREIGDSLFLRSELAGSREWQFHLLPARTFSVSVNGVAAQIPNKSSKFAL